jgi:hypothetical protein
MSAQQRWLSLFLEFISHLTIDSKETGVSRLHLYNSQKRFLEQVCEGLDRGVRHFVCLKARQLGISTISLAMDLFWLSVHEGLQGALITDTEGNRDKFRILLERYIGSLPRGYRVPVVKHNRTNLVFGNGSVLDYVVAGTRKAGSGTMARSRAWNFVHATEVSSWGSEEGIASMIASLAQQHPDRLYVFESTARGKNLFWEMCNDAAEDTHTQKMFFIGWWAKEDYMVARTDPRFKDYWTGRLDPGETVLVKEVEKKYGFVIMPEQIVWHRWMRTVKIGDEDLMNQEYPWTAEQAFIESGKSFFPARRVADDIAFIRRERIAFKGYCYRMTENFMQTELEQVTRVRDTELRIWEDPHPNGIYVAGVDPAYGRSDLKDRHCIEIYRCFADALVQVAEYATDVPETYQVAWVLAHLAGSYKNVWINLEINGPGPAVMRELQHLRQLMDSGYLREQAAERKLDDVFSATRWYLYHRPDSIGAGYAYGWKTTMDNKILILNQLRDAYSLRHLRVRSVPLLQEMETVIQDGSSIEASGRNKDDRVFASALANKAYIDWIRPNMIANNLTYESVIRAERAALENPNQTMMHAIVQDWFRIKEEERAEEEIQRAWSTR